MFIRNSQISVTQRNKSKKYQEGDAMSERKIINAVSANRVPKWGNQKKYIAVHYLGVVGQNHDLEPGGYGAHFYIYWDGTIYQRCSLDAVVWAVGTGGMYTQKHPEARNANTISIEMCCKCDGNSASAEDKKWYFTKETQEACVWLVQKLMKENGIPADHVLRHYDIVNKTCPAPYVHNNKYKTSWTWDEFKKRLIGANTDAQEDTDKIWLGWVKRESGSAGFRQTNGDSGNAYGKYQFDRRYALVPFMQFCVEYSQQHYSGFQPYIAYGAGSVALKNNTALAKLWTQYCDKYPAEFEALQDTYAYQAYYLEGKKYMKNLHGIQMDYHSPALKGSLFSMAIRSGSLSAARKFTGCNDQTDDATMINKSYATYGNADAARWTKAGQWGDALKALETGEYTEVKVDMEKGDILPDTDKPWLRVRKAWADAKSQLGAFHDLEKAKAVTDKNPGYYVFDESGKIIYPEKKTNQQIIDAACAWAVEIANDNSHGYNNKGQGWGPEYNCIGLVMQAYNQAGLDLGKVSIDKMAGRLLAKGFLDCTGSVNFKTGSGLQKGDVLLMLDATGKHGHTELCLGGSKVVGARNDDDGKKGDGTGHEIAVSAYFNYNWQRVFRLPGSTGSGRKKYRVQTGAYEQKKLANQQIARLKNKGFDACLKVDGKWNIVQAGVFDSKENAEELKRQLKAKRFDAMVKEV